MAAAVAHNTAEASVALRCLVRQIQAQGVRLVSTYPTTGGTPVTWRRIEHPLEELVYRAPLQVDNEPRFADCGILQRRKPRQQVGERSLRFGNHALSRGRPTLHAEGHPCGQDPLVRERLILHVSEDCGGAPAGEHLN